MAGLLWGKKQKKCLEARFEGVQRGFLSERKGKVIPLRGPKTEKAAKEAFPSALEVPNHEREVRGKEGGKGGKGRAAWGVGGETDRKGEEKEKGRDRQTHKQAGRKIEVDREKDTHRLRDRDRQRDTDIQTEGYRQTEKRGDRRAGRETQTDSKTETDGQTDRDRRRKKQNPLLQMFRPLFFPTK